METVKQYVSSKKPLAMVLVAMVFGIIIGYAVRGDDPGARQPADHGQPLAGLIEPVDHEHAASLQSELQKEETIYICPMNCVPPMEKAGTCPVCGMDLVGVPASEHQHDQKTTTVSFAPETLQAADIRTAPVERKFVTTPIRLFGKIEYDPTEQYKVTAFAPGVIDKIYVKRPGVGVRRGDALFDLHSAELFYLEQELFDTLEKFPYVFDMRPGRGQRFKRWVRPYMAPAQPAKPGSEGQVDEKEQQAVMEQVNQIRRKMRFLGLSRTDIDRVIARGSPTGISTLVTPTTGVLLEHNAYKGMYVNTGDVIMTVANPRYLWARLDAYESDFAWIRFGQEAEFETYALPGEKFKGKVVNIDPEFDVKTRTFKVGVLYTDPDTRLEPYMLVRCVIHAKVKATTNKRRRRQPEDNLPPLVIPDTAPLVTGTRAVVYVAVPEKSGTFEGREIVLGPRAEGYYIVKAGLKEGERVVVNGNFKIDSAVQILAKSSMMEHSGGQAMSGHDHHGTSAVMDMGQPMDQGRRTPTRAEEAVDRARRLSPVQRQTQKGPQHEMHRGPQRKE